MNLSAEQLEDVKAGKPLRLEISGVVVYALSEDLFDKVRTMLQSDPEQEAFRKFSMRQAQRIAI